MDFLERIEYIESLPFEKQLLIAVMSSERAYRETLKVFPKGLANRPIFRQALDALWKFVNAQESVTEAVLKSIDLEIFKYVKDEFDYKADEWFVSYHTIIKSLARSLNLTIGMIRRGAETGESSGNVTEKAAHIFDVIYEDRQDSGEAYDKEIEWLTKATYLIAETEEIAPHYDWFLQKIPDYERGKIDKEFQDFE
jgi:hypothetical protein